MKRSWLDEPVFGGRKKDADRKSHSISDYASPTGSSSPTSSDATGNTAEAVQEHLEKLNAGQRTVEIFNLPDKKIVGYPELLGMGGTLKLINFGEITREARRLQPDGKLGPRACAAYEKAFLEERDALREANQVEGVFLIPYIEIAPRTDGDTGTRDMTDDDMARLLRERGYHVEAPAAETPPPPSPRVQSLMDAMGISREQAEQILHIVSPDDGSDSDPTPPPPPAHDGSSGGGRRDRRRR